MGAEPFPWTSMRLAMAQCRDAGLSFVVAPVAHARLERRSAECGCGSTAARASVLGRPLTRSDTVLTSEQWSAMVVGKLSAWIDLDARDSQRRRDAEAALVEETQLAMHLGLPAVLAPRLRSFAAAKSVFANDNYARAMSHVLVKGSGVEGTIHVWVQVAFERWAEWDRFRTMCDTPSNLHVALVLGSSLLGGADEDDGIDDGTAGAGASGDDDEAEMRDGDDDDDARLQQWLGEPVRGVVVPTCAFVPNAKGYPTLPPRLKTLVVALYARKAQFVLTGKARHQHGYVAYQRYLAHICRAAFPECLTEREEFEDGWLDYLQVPLQPLGNNLESNTYEVFEKDPVKYARYREAVRRALLARAHAAPTQERFVVMVVGAGRGPLVRESLAAADAAGLLDRVHVYAVEKNANAVVTLLNAVRTAPRWSGRVTVVSSDMRKWTAPALADVIVSELLGSWGDNELSPECLAGVERFLRPGSGVSVPCRYTSYLAPIESHKVWSSVRDLLRGGGPHAPWGKPESIDASVARFDTPYVVRLFNFVHVDEPQPVFVFTHSAPGVAADETSLSTSTFADVAEAAGGERASSKLFERFVRVEFRAQRDATLHGFAGYFSADLFEDVGYSIHPDTYSHGMFSWFPLFLPLRAPLRVNRGDAVYASVWRRIDASRVWYEWSVTLVSSSSSSSSGKPRVVTTPVQNSGGVAYHVAL